MLSREPLNNNTQKLSIIDMVMEKKAIIIFGLLTLVALVGAVFFLSRGNETSLPEDQVVAKNGLHWHPKLEVYIKGEKQEFTDSIGLGAVHQEMHTHAQDYKDGVVHMEMQGLVTKKETRIGRFFEIWGKKFNSSQIFESKNSTSSAVKMLVNGKTNNDFENYQMRNGDKIEIKYE